MKIKNGFVLREVGGQAIVIAVGEASKNFHGMIKLNGTAKDIWELIGEGLSVDEISEKLSEKYGIAVTTASADVSEFIEKLDKAGILEL